VSDCGPVSCGNMLGASKLQILAGLKLAGTDLRSRELDFYMERYITLGGVSSIMCSLTYVGLIKIAIPVKLHRAQVVARGHALQRRMISLHAGVQASQLRSAWE
jgi:hypothetical protein